MRAILLANAIMAALAGRRASRRMSQGVFRDERARASRPQPIKLGHTVRLIPPAYVKPYVRRGKDDTADTAAICEAVTRPSMRFVAVKPIGQQGALMVHRCPLADQQIVAMTCCFI